MKKDPPSNDDLYRLGEEISRKISPAVSPFRKLSNGNTVFIGAAGTVTALAAMARHLTKYEHDKIHKFKLSIVSVRNISSTISVLTSKERARHIPFIVPGTLILLKLMEFFGFKEITVSNDGLREGILIELYKKISG
jgi:exopolyphosphatase/guanosine-5'-triphosphate,3'-diphosphate pyrophosphatase